MKALLIAAALAFATTGAIAQDKAHDEHAEHDHGDHGHGEHQDLGTTTVAGIKFQAFQLGKLEEKEGIFEIALAKEGAKPKAIRVWVGNEAAEGSVKLRAEGDGPEYDLHVELPKPLPKDAQFWVEVQPAEGKKDKAAFSLKQK